MARFQKIPVEIEAVQILVRTQEDYPFYFGESPEWLSEAVKNGTLTAGYDDLRGYYVYYIKTLNGIVEARPSSWIMKGVQGELYPCANDIFLSTHQPVEETE